MTHCNAPGEEPHLILHKVRGQPAYDIAIRLTISSEHSREDWWIIPTSGHRAYPYKVWPLTELEGDVGNGYFAAVLFEVPADLQDHYHLISTSQAKEKKLDLKLEDLGL